MILGSKSNTNLHKLKFLSVTTHICCSYIVLEFFVYSHIHLERFVNIERKIESHSFMEVHQEFQQFMFI